jgi:hypothetical protein
MAVLDPIKGRSAALRGRVPQLARGVALRRAIRTAPRPLVLILIVGAVQALAWDVAVPAFQGPDESAHYAYVQYLAETGKLPSVPRELRRQRGSLEEQDALNWLNLRPAIGNYLQTPAWSSADLKLWHQVERSMPRGSRVTGSGLNALAKNPPLYYAVMSIPYRLLVWLPVLKRVFLLRLFNALFYLATIALVWLIAGEVFGRVRWKQTLAAGVVALEPQLSFLGAIINADTLLVTLSTGFLLAVIRLVRRGPSVRRVLAASLLAAAAVLTHGRGLVTLPLLAVALVVTWIKYRPVALQTLKLAAASVATVGTGFLGYVLFGRGTGSGALYGGQVSELNSGRGFKLGQFLSTVYQFYLPPFPSIPKRIGPRSGYGYRQVYIESFYGSFGSQDTSLAPRLYNLLQTLSAFGLVALYTAVVVRARKLLRSWPVVVVLVAWWLGTVVFLHYVSYRAMLENGGQEPLIVGRYLLPIIPLFGLAIAFTAGALPRRGGQLLGAAILAAGVLLSLTSIGLTIARFYA